MKTLHCFILFVTASLTAISAPRPAYSGYAQNSYLAQQIWLDSMGNFIGAPVEQLNAPWNGSAFVFGLYVYDPALGAMTGASLVSGSGVSYNATTEALTFGINDATQTALNLKATSSALATVATSGAYSDLTGKPSLATVATSGAYADLSGKPSLATVATTGVYSDLTGKPTIPAAQVNSDWSAVSGVTQILNKPTLTNGTVTSVTAGTGLSGGTFTTSGTVSMPNTGTPGTYSGVTTDTQGRITAGTNRSFNNSASKTLVTSATAQGGVVLDASRDASVTYSLSTSTTATIGGASSVTAYLEIAGTNSATAGDWTAIQTVATGQTVTLAIALQSVQSNSLTVSGMIPAGQYVRIRYAVTGTGSCSYINGQEVKS